MKWSAASASGASKPLDGLKGIESLLLTPGGVPVGGKGASAAGSGRSSLLLTSVTNLGASFDEGMSEMELGLSPLRPGLVEKASHVISSVTSFLPTVKKVPQKPEQAENRVDAKPAGGGTGAKGQRRSAAAAPARATPRPAAEEGEKVSDKIIRSLQKALTKERKRSMRVLEFSEQLTRKPQPQVARHALSPSFVLSEESK